MKKQSFSLKIQDFLESQSVSDFFKTHLARDTHPNLQEIFTLRQLWKRLPLTFITKGQCGSKGNVLFTV